ncbi:MAG TPA: prepilin-type N-terminal cleavage/methylation domain-containing protein [Vicinamibacterales bacterium]|nr:prepilin-type N-terminal cleavage/methylation domain-containing protein [Vicinamibacterales bacterium]
MTSVRRESGYSLIELLVSMAIMMVVTGAIFALVDPSQSTSQTQPEVQDMQQRMRVSTDTLYKDLVMAGAGPYQGAVTGSLVNFFAPVLPRRTGLVGAEAATVARADAITLVYIPNSYSQTTIRSGMPITSAELKVNDQANCPGNDQLCGFSEGDVILIFDEQGHFDTFTITNVQDDAGHLQHRGQTLSYDYDVGAAVMMAETHTYYLNSTDHQLRQYDGGNEDVPVADNVVGLEFAYFGEPDTSKLSKPQAPITTSCLYPDGSTLVSGLATLSNAGGSLAPMPLSTFTDGPWCGEGTNQFDADLLRVRKIRVTLRVQAATAAFRGTDPLLFANPGTAIGGTRFIPDMVTTFDVTPRNLNLTR